jgi:hypothetical protein
MAEGNAGAAATKSRWIYLVIGFVVSIVLGLVYAWSIFTLPLEKAFGWTRSDTSLAFSFSIVTLSIGMIFGGRIQDRKGPKLVAVAGAACLAIGFFAASFTTSLWMLYVFYGVMVGLGVGLIYICLISVVARWYPDRRGLGMGILTMGLGLIARRAHLGGVDHEQRLAGAHALPPLNQHLLHRPGDRRGQIERLALHVASQHGRRVQPGQEDQQPDQGGGGQDQDGYQETLRAHAARPSSKRMPDRSARACCRARAGRSKASAPTGTKVSRQMTPRSIGAAKDRA